MKNYLITFVRNADYCKVDPSNPDCHVDEFVQADNKAQAVNRFYKLFPFRMDARNNRLPFIWTIEER